MLRIEGAHRASAVFITILIVYLVFEITYLSEDSVLAQSRSDSSKTSEIGWYQIAQLSLISGAVSALISALFNFKIAIKQIEANRVHFEKEIRNDRDKMFKEFMLTMRQIKEGRYANVIESKLNLYAKFIYNLKNDLIAIQSEGGSDFEKIDKITEDTDLMLQDKFYLLSTRVVEKWLSAKEDLANESAVTDLKKELEDEYNNEILPIYNQLIGGKLRPIG